MRRSVMSKGAALLAATTALGLAAAPAFAAPPDYSAIAQATGTAVSVTLAGSGTDSDAYTSRIDYTGTRDNTGSNRPLLTALGGQDFLSAGTLAQDATTAVRNGVGTSAACAGLAGDGATLVSAGDGNCLRGGETLSLGVGSLDFSKLTVVQSGLFQGVDSQIETALAPYQKQLTQALSDGLTQVVDALGDPALHLDLGAVQSHCTADGRTVSGASNLANVGAWVNIPTVGRVDLVKLPVNPAPNTHVVTDLSGVVDALAKPLKQNLGSTLPNALDSIPGLGAALKPVLAQLRVGLDQVTRTLEQNVLDQLSSQLAPLQDNLLDITLNKQQRGAGSIEVTALDLAVLPVARQFVDGDALHLTVGTSSCGPNRAVSARPTTPQTAKPAARAPEHVPTVVTAGYADASDADSPMTAGRAALFGLLVLVAGGSGLTAYRRARR